MRLAVVAGMVIRLFIVFVLLALLPGCPSSVETEPSPSPLQHHEDGFLVPSTFHLPEDGTPNDNGSIGPFCCTGVTATVQTTDGYAAGYVYFFSWVGPAITDGKTSFAPDVTIRLAGLANAHDPASALEIGEISWTADEMKILEVKSAQVGQLQFTVTIEQVSFVSSSEGDLFNMGSLKVRVDVTVVD